MLGFDCEELVGLLPDDRPPFASTRCRKASRGFDDTGGATSAGALLGAMLVVVDTGLFTGTVGLWLV